MKKYSGYNAFDNNCRCFVNIFLDLFLGISTDFCGLMFDIWFGGKLMKTNITSTYSYNFLIKEPIYFLYEDKRWSANGCYKILDDKCDPDDSPSNNDIKSNFHIYQPIYTILMIEF